ncbi:BTAD domain-containing putative transcriptional regulator [Oryzobacter telluris]|uniref:BTAD domain-containing putative transcriptional regulator n=1 Tax=Oryzobacter telluris TaxID=3149179 RepID=UPI00370DB15E
MRVRVLGSTVVDGPGGPVPLAARKPRSILAALALAPRSTTSADRLVDLVWGDEPPAGAHGTLHAYISGLRRVLEPDLAPRARPTVLVTTDDGYRLEVDPSDVDAVAFTREVRARHSALAPLWSQLTTGPGASWPTRAEVAAHVEALEESLRTWSGTAYADLGDHPAVLADRAALDELRATAEEDTALGLLAVGEHAAVLAATEQAAGRHPLRERTRSLQALALVRTGRQVEALEVLRGYRELLADELGLDPGPEVRALEEAVLRQDPALSHWLRPDAPPAPVTTPPTGTVVDAAASTPSVPSGSWGTVGRDAEHALVADVLASTAAGAPGAVLVVGDPGSGKTRLVDDALATAGDLGFTTAVGRCSQDDGAPPLWPWFALLDGLGLDRPAELDREPEDGGDAAGAERAFSVQDALARAVRRRAEDDPVLLVVEDLHWADTRTLRALVHLVTTLGPRDRVAVVATRRARPQPTGALADLGVALARHGARTVELSGLAVEDARTLVAAVTGSGAAAARVDQWCESTGGNPFFLVELARLAASTAGWRGEVPESVQTVLARRLDDLPDPTREALLVSAALGREHSPLLLAHVGGWSPDEVADRLEAAQEQGIVHQRDDGRLVFEHALTRDAVLAAASPARVSRAHARIAHALESLPRGAVAPAERAFDLAHHWLAAGPVHAPQAWRAAATAAAEARRDFANVEATDLYRAALDAHALDPAGTREERYDLLLSFTEAAAWAAQWRPVVDAVIEAVALARADEDPERMARAATSLTRYSAWLPQEHDEVHEDLVDDLRWALRGLDHHDSTTRCILMLALAVQLYYRRGSEPEVEALVDEGLAAARRLGDPGLRAWAARTGWLALWRVEHLDRRRALAHEELGAARDSGDEAALALAHVALAGTALEDGDRETWLEHSAAADDIARRRRLTYVEFVLHFVRLSLTVLEGDDEGAAAHTEAMRTLGEQSLTPAKEWTEFGISYLLALWDPVARAAVLPQMLHYFAQTPDDFVRSPVIQLLALDGEVDRLRVELDRAPLVPMVDNWYVVSEAAGRVEAAALVGDTDLARTAVTVLQRAEGRFVVSGISTVYGPVDGYLALGHALLGDVGRATALADAAERLATVWAETTYLAWLAERRRRHAF